jgi:hypothetical protein
MNKLAVLVTTFLRDNLLEKTLENLIAHASEETIILVADQGYRSDEKNEIYSFLEYSVPGSKIFYLPFDCGLSYARNYLVTKAAELNCLYILMLDDSWQSTIPLIDLRTHIDYLDTQPPIGAISFNPDGLYSFSLQTEVLNITPISVKRNKEASLVDIFDVPFLGKTLPFHQLWDEDLKLPNNILPCVELKNRGFEALYTPNKYFVHRLQSNKEYEEHLKKKKYYDSLIPLKLGIKTIKEK